MTLPLTLNDIERAAEVHWTSGTAIGSRWDEFRGRFFPLPDWFDHSLNPLSEAYACQQHRLWQLIAGRDRPYCPELDEQTPEIVQSDPLGRPAFYTTSPEVAGDHLIALGHMLKHSGISAGDRVLEYGAGFGQIGLTFARLGAIVDTVDISPEFCQAVKVQAEWFGVPLMPYLAQFGANPRPGEQYKLIIFYESFHHCRDFLRLITQLKEIVTTDGKVLMAGEPIAVENVPEIPFPWGIRLDAENVAVVRKRGWFEIGFQEDFLIKCFIKNGFVYRKYPGIISSYATIYEFRPKPPILALANMRLAPSDDRTWHSVDPGGRWTTGRSMITIDSSDLSPGIGIRVTNYHDRNRTVRFICGRSLKTENFAQHETKEILLERDGADADLVIECETLCPRIYGVPDDRELGIFVEWVRYLGL
jgi:2-polyprenyl-3-methyl-5-hydroxy-6-metoxy-1,4-benzoquinol methylase